MRNARSSSESARRWPAVELLDPVDQEVMDVLDAIALAEGVDRATLIPAVLRQYIARKAYEAALIERRARQEKLIRGAGTAARLVENGAQLVGNAAWVAGRQIGKQWDACLIRRIRAKCSETVCLTEPNLR